MKSTVVAVFALLLFAGLGNPDNASAQGNTVKNIVIVHGAFADGSGWQGVFKILTAKGYNVTIVQNPLTGLEDDVAAVNRALDKQAGPVILVGHSWGGAVITETGASSKVVGLVYVAALQPDAGQSPIQSMSAPPLPENGILPPDSAGFVYFDKAKFHAGFAADLPADQAAFMYASQIPIAAKAFGTPLTHAAWRTKPSWGIVPTLDKAIDPAFERSIYKRSGTKVTEVPGASHVVFISHPKEVAAVIEAAARGSI